MMRGSDVLRMLRHLGSSVIVYAKYLLLYPCIAPRKAIRFLRTMGRLTLLTDHNQSCALIAEQPLQDLFPGIGRVEVILTDVVREGGNVSVEELYALCAIARVRQARAIFEIGTFNGLVTAQLARNTDAQTHLITVDLPPADVRQLAAGNMAYVQHDVTGAHIQRLPAAVRAKITQIYGDSAQVDLRPYYGQMDLVFIDGSHQRDYVEHDTQSAFRLRSPRGVIVWHDYLVWPDVARYLNTLRQQQVLRHITGTSLVVCLPPEELRA